MTLGPLAFAALVWGSLAAVAAAFASLLWALLREGVAGGSSGSRPEVEP
ncbi:MAG: hypothetical protein ABEJ04_06595 [Halobacteriaceae archaeon]